MTGRKPPAEPESVILDPADYPALSPALIADINQHTPAGRRRLVAQVASAAPPPDPATAAELAWLIGPGRAPARQAKAGAA